ncbi:hypothetical protein BKP42_63420 [Rhodococcus erythropolis]|nr:hypothetical protein BKP42_63420 [Rhodococcus erythropolis]
MGSGDDIEHNRYELVEEHRAACKGGSGGLEEIRKLGPDRDQVGVLVRRTHHPGKPLGKLDEPKWRRHRAEQQRGTLSDKAQPMQDRPTLWQHTLELIRDTRSNVVGAECYFFFNSLISRVAYT